ncbi:FAD:protein FMN transferase [Pontiella sp.]|uniref:FAD:protein FMN transferase n=1 Tax=Pontiella sp. TaxID=2837462 RepID=UPI003569C042
MQQKQFISILAGLAIVLILGIGGLVRFSTIENPAHWGESMGTTYSVKISGKVKRSLLKQIKQRIDGRLAEINAQMSTWEPDSEISSFNRSRSVQAFPCSEAFASVVERALQLAESTEGAFDPTLQPLLNLWGFGSGGEQPAIPSDDEVAAARKKTGWRKLTSRNWAIEKAEPEISLDLGAIAKGYGVDALARILEQAGLENWFVEIGGEVVVKGLNPDGMPWKIGIQFPTTNPMEDGRLQGIVHMTNGAVATSGDYRNYIEEDGVIYSHILDPRSGRAVRSNTASVTVVAPDCMDADGIATALFVMGADAGLAWVEDQPQVEALFLLRGENGEINEKFSSGFRKASGYTSSL